MRIKKERELWSKIKIKKILCSRLEMKNTTKSVEKYPCAQIEKTKIII